MTRGGIAFLLMSLLAPSWGILSGACIIIIAFVDWGPVKPTCTKQQILRYGGICVILGIIDIVIWGLLYSSLG